MAKKLIPQLLKEVSEAKTNKDKVEILRANTHPRLKDVLRVNIELDVVSLLPEGAPP